MEAAWRNTLHLEHKALSLAKSKADSVNLFQAQSTGHPQHKSVSDVGSQGRPTCAEILKTWLQVS